MKPDVNKESLGLMWIKSRELLIATSNPGKVREIRRAFSGLAFRIKTLKDLPIVLPVEEAGETYEENAAAKALAYAAQTGMPALADDSGLEVESLGGRPGVRSARFGGSEISDSARNHLLLNSLDSDSSRQARFVCVSVIAAPITDGKDSVRVLAIFSGVCLGVIADNPRGVNGFGYDSIFIPKGHKKTFGELSDSIKDRISHRAQALCQMRSFLEYLSRELDQVEQRS